jgi:tetratricopeptide (TPR) repeat protein
LIIFGRIVAMSAVMWRRGANSWGKCVSAVFLFSILTASNFAIAENNDAARQAYELGRRAYNLARFEEAAAKFEESYQLSGDPTLLFNVAQSHRQAGKRQEALTIYRAYLREVPSADNAERVEGLIAKVEAELSGSAVASDVKRPSANEDLTDPFAEARAPKGRNTAPPANRSPSGLSAYETTAPWSPVSANTPTKISNDESRPLHKRWELWAGVLVAVGATVTIVYLLSGTGDDSGCQGISPCGTLE